MKKCISIIMIIAVILSMLSACSLNKKENEEKTRKIVDITGAEVEIPNKVNEVVNLFPFDFTSSANFCATDSFLSLSIRSKNSTTAHSV